VEARIHHERRCDVHVLARVEHAAARGGWLGKLLVAERYGGSPDHGGAYDGEAS
jgi:hypothetical protein